MIAFIFFFTDSATTEIYTLSLHDALPICDSYLNQSLTNVPSILSHFSSSNASVFEDRKSGSAGMPRPISYAVFCLKKKREGYLGCNRLAPWRRWRAGAGPSVPSDQPAAVV